MSNKCAVLGRLRLKCGDTRAETRFRLSAKRTSPFKSTGASVQSTTGNRGVRISGSNAGYTMFRGSVKGTGYPLHSPVSPSLPLLASSCAITFHLDSKGLHSFHAVDDDDNNNNNNTLYKSYYRWPNFIHVDKNKFQFQSNLFPPFLNLFCDLVVKITIV
jgi:hypothetical protein